MSTIKHGLTGHQLHNMWRNMIQRCYDKNHTKYKWYGQRGITVCDAWKYDFKIFYKWAINNGWVSGLSIERNKINEGYSPENCSLIEFSRQARNKSNSRFLTFNGETMCLADWSDRTGLSHSTISKRLKSKWTVEKALLTPKLK